ncbi:hypothetical protein [Streptomyces malaysiensis]|uniref:Uncharacterized protein n=1 Tax=Streptomyces malaysiensis subsp. samsunensis TaxID=459658 RepID=A0A9X2M5I8_STRMQ|nr:hypothetical protein [Streptomyces samsunensis]MCQ8835803.1 hypothetical protein [Streptomyces samsunensis]
MDQGLAAVLGAFVGVVGTTATAVFTGRYMRQQAQDQAHIDHARWRREIRQETYAAMLVPITEARAVAREASRALIREDTDAEVESLLGQLEELIQTIRASCARLYLEGPIEVVRAGDAVLRKLRVVDNNLVTWKDSRVSSSEHPAEYIERHTIKAAEVASSVNWFTHEASKALDSTG